MSNEEKMQYTADCFYNSPVRYVDEGPTVWGFLSDLLGYTGLYDDEAPQDRMIVKAHEIDNDNEFSVSSLWFDDEAIAFCINYNRWWEDNEEDIYITNEEGYKRMFTFISTLVKMKVPLIDRYQVLDIKE